MNEMELSRGDDQGEVARFNLTPFSLVKMNLILQLGELYLKSWLSRGSNTLKVFGSSSSETKL